MTQKDSEDQHRLGEPREPADIDPASQPNSIPAPAELDETTDVPAGLDVQPANGEPLPIEPPMAGELMLQTPADGNAEAVEHTGTDLIGHAHTDPAPVLPREPVEAILEPVSYVAELAPHVSPRSWTEAPQVETAGVPDSSIEEPAHALDPARNESDTSDAHEIEHEFEPEPQPQVDPAPPFETAPPLQPIQDTEQPPEPEPIASAPAIVPPEPRTNDPVPRQEPQWQAPPANAVFQAVPAPSDKFDFETAIPPEDRWDRAKEVARTGLRYAGYAIAGYFAVVFVLILLYRFINPPASTLMVAQALTGTDVRQDWVSLDEISPALVRAVIVSEDWTFCEHYGIDIKAIEQAIERSGNGIPRGASTISMQTTKNLFLWNAKSYIRKIIELPLTLAIELVWPKHRILEIYLNVAEWGPGIFGAEAAAQYHFNKPASRLGEREAAQLAASLPNPIIREAGDPGPRTARKATVIQSRMRNAGDAAQCVLGARR